MCFMIIYCLYSICMICRDMNRFFLGSPEIDRRMLNVQCTMIYYDTVQNELQYNTIQYKKLHIILYSTIMLRSLWYTLKTLIFDPSPHISYM